MPLQIRTTFSCCVLLLFLFSSRVTASVVPTILVRVASDSIYNGVSENAEQPIIALNAEFQLNTNWVAGIQFQDSEPESVRQRNRNISAYLGYDKKISNDWLSSTYYTHRAFPGGAREWDYDEFSSRLSHKSGASLGVSYAPNYYSSSVKAISSSFRYTRPIIDNIYMRAELGNLTIPTLFNYQFGELTVGTRYKRFNIELGYHWTSDTFINTPVSNIRSPQFVFSLNYVAF